MTHRTDVWIASLRALIALIALTALSALPAAAQYKVVAPDGSVTYTDRPSANVVGKITPLRRTSSDAADAGNAALPLELRQASSRFPVTLYSAENCPSCTAGKTLLAQRGIPYTERVIRTEEEALELERNIGWRTVPTLTIGAQALRGLSAAEWGAYLDVAGYPTESRLPKGWKASSAAASAASGAAPNAEAAPAPRAGANTTPSTSPSTSPIAAPDLTPAPPGKIRF